MTAFWALSGPVPLSEQFHPLPWGQWNSPASLSTRKKAKSSRQGRLLSVMGHKKPVGPAVVDGSCKGKEQGISIDLTFLVQMVKFGSSVLPSPQTLPAFIPVHSGRERSGRRVKHVPQVTEIGSTLSVGEMKGPLLC